MPTSVRRRHFGRDNPQGITRWSDQPRELFLFGQKFWYTTTLAKAPKTGIPFKTDFGKSTIEVALEG